MSANNNFIQRLRQSLGSAETVQSTVQDSPPNETSPQAPQGIESLNRKRGVSPVTLAAIVVLIAGIALVLLTPKGLEVLSAMRPKAPTSNEANKQAQTAQNTASKPMLDDGADIVPTGVITPKKPIELIDRGGKTPSPSPNNTPIEISPTSPAQTINAGVTAGVDIRLVGDTYIATSKSKRSTDTATIAPSQNSLSGSNSERQNRTDAELIFGNSASDSATSPPNTQNPARSNAQTERAPDTVQARVAQAGGKFPTVAATRTPDRAKSILAGRSIPCTLDDALDSSLPGFVNCTIQRPVLSEDASCVLIPAGSRAIGEYLGRQEQGQRRIFFVWREIQTTRHIISTSSVATDALGRSGIDGAYDSRFLERFRGALLLSIVNGSSNRNGGNVIAPAVQAATDSAVQLDLNIPPITTLEQGRAMLIRVAQNWTFDTSCTAP